MVDLKLVLKCLRVGRARIVDPANWRPGGNPDTDAPSDAPPYCSGSALWDKRGGEKRRAVEAEAVRILLRAAALVVSEDEDAELDARSSSTGTTRPITRRFLQPSTARFAETEAVI